MLSRSPAWNKGADVGRLGLLLRCQTWQRRLRAARGETSLPYSWTKPCRRSLQVPTQWIREQWSSSTSLQNFNIVRENGYGHGFGLSFTATPRAGGSLPSLNRKTKCVRRKEGGRREDTGRTVSYSQLDHKAMNCFYLFQGKKDDEFLFRKLKENISIPVLSSSCQSCLTFVLCAPLQALIQEPLPHWGRYSSLDTKETCTRKLGGHCPHHMKDSHWRTKIPISSIPKLLQ